MCATCYIQRIMSMNWSEDYVFVGWRTHSPGYRHMDCFKSVYKRGVCTGAEMKMLKWKTAKLA